MRVCRFLLCLLFYTLFLPLHAHTGENTEVLGPVPAESLLSSFFRTKSQQIATLTEDTAFLTQETNQTLTAFVPLLKTSQEKLQIIEVMARMTSSDPNDMRVALAEVRYLQHNLSKAYQPLQILDKALNDKLLVVQSLSEDIKRKWAAELTEPLQKDVLNIRKRAESLYTNLEDLKQRVDEQKIATTLLQERLSVWVLKFEKELPLIWKAEFLDKEQFILRPQSATSMRKDCDDWQDNMQYFVVGQFSSTEQAGDWVSAFVLLWLPFVVLGVITYRFLGRVFKNRNAGGKRTAAFGITTLSLGLSLLVAFLLGTVKQTSLLLLITHALILLGLQTLAWLFRNVQGILKKRQNFQPLWPLVFLSINVAILGFLRLPAWLEHGSWLALLVSSSLFFGFARAPLRYERTIRALHPYVLTILILVAFLGWANLAMLCSTLWGVLAISLQFGLGATGVIQAVVEDQDKSGLRAMAADLGRTLATLALWLTILLGIMTWLTINLGTSAVFEKLSSMKLGWGEFSFNFGKILLVLLLFQIVRSLAMAWKAILDTERIESRTFDRGAAASLQRIGIYFLWMLFALISLNMLGISLTNFAVIAGGLSVGIGFGMQTMISNFISGLILLFDRSIQPGDVIEVNGLWARVVSVNIRNTLVQTFENAKIFVPNSELIANQVTNWTYKNDVRIRRDIAVGVAYGSDVNLVKKLLEKAANEHPAVMPKPAPWVIFNDFGGSSLDFILRFWVRDVDLCLSASSEIRGTIDSKFREHGVEIPFPQMDLHMREGDGTLRIATQKRAARKAPSTTQQQAPEPQKPQEMRSEDELDQISTVKPTEDDKKP